ncbi:hypothetical protein ZIOFF_001366 [Zingiber officinale]|uniref:HECT-type E3 ubiquitin transferase n=1 Tax=Zingiber officinale TaxID=94328 RepID=A0A8J5LUZ5_ZINOF|nr:hypothetical protein ZIOFF_001366 [Zingiber officinale]
MHMAKVRKATTRTIMIGGYISPTSLNVGYGLSRLEAIEGRKVGPGLVDLEDWRDISREWMHITKRLIYISKLKQRGEKRRQESGLQGKEESDSSRSLRLAKSPFQCHIAAKFRVTDYELIPGGRNIRVTEETKHEYVDLVAEHILTTAIHPQINSFLEGFNELVPKELISIFNDKELKLLLSGLPEIDLDDLQANTEYTGYSTASTVIQWFWEVVKSFNKEDMARLLQFITGTSKVPLEGFKALQGISGPQQFQIHKAYMVLLKGCPLHIPGNALPPIVKFFQGFNQLDLPEYSSREQLEERLLLAIHEASEGFGFG